MRRVMTWLVVLGLAMSTVGCAWCCPKKSESAKPTTATKAPAERK